MKKWLCAILCLVLVLGMIPVFPASAAQSEEYSIMQEQSATIAPSDQSVKGVWYNNGSTFVTDAGAANYIEVVKDGCKDAGALHVYQDNVTNHDMSIGMFLGGQPAGTYTVKLNVKGDLGYLNQTCKFFIPGNDAQSPNLHTALGTTDVADWTEVTYEITAASTFYYLIFSFSKYNWQTDMYIDNVKLLNSDGVDLLLGGGDFYTLEEVTVSSGDTKQWPDASALDTSVISSAYGGSLEGVWTPMYPTGTPGNSESWATWPAWDDTHYAEVVANGYKDAGSLHLVSCGGKNTGIAINAGMTAGETYTLGFYAKGTVNTGRVLAMYDNGGGVIISDTASFKAGWNYYEHTFTATRNQLNILAADWGSVDIYLDNITLKNADGEDLLAGSGDFYTNTAKVYYTIMQEQPATIAPTDNAVKGVWYNNGSTFVTDAGTANYIEVTKDGCNDAGALHVYQDMVANYDMGLGMFLGGQPAGTYTLKFYVKGNLGTYSNQACKFYIPGYDGQVTNLTAKLDTLSVADWTEVSYEITTTGDFYYLIFTFSKYNWKTDMYIDNVKLLNSDGVDLLLGGGDFYTLEEVTVSSDDTKQWPDDTDLNTSKISSAYGHTLENAWTPMYPSGTAGDPNFATWPAWDDTHYAEVVANGYKDAGSLHLVSCGSKNTGIAINAGMTAGETYTLGFYAKGTVNTGRVLAMYDNGGGVIISDTASFKAGWNYYEHTFTATRNQLNILAADWGSVDIYIDNITLKNAGGEDLLAGIGDFYRDTAEAPEEPEQPTEPEIPTEPEVEGLAVISDAPERAYRWYWNGVPYTQTDYSKVNVSGWGADDPGSLHIWQSTTGSSDINMCIINSMASDLDSGSYTLSMNIKGTFCNTEGFAVYPAFANFDLSSMNVPQKLLEVTGVTANADGMYVVDEWTNLTWTIPADANGDTGFTYLALHFSKYNNTCEYFIDNIQVLDPNGNDMLCGAGSFMDSGSEYWPIILPASGGKVLNSDTMYYKAYVNECNVSVSNHEEMGYVAGDQNFAVTHNGMTQSASNKNVTMQMAPAKEGEPVVFAITSNAGSVDFPSSKLEIANRADEFNFYDITFSAIGCSHSYSDWNVVKSATYTEAGSKSKTCSLCGDTVTEEIPVLANPVTGYNIVLRDNIGVNFQMNLADTDEVIATVNGAVVSFEKNGNIISVSVAAAQMMDEIAICVNGMPLANTYTVRGYADYILNGDYSDATKELVKYMLVYGGAAQTYFGYNSDSAENLASNGITVVAKVPTGDGKVEMSGKVTGASFYGATLVHETKTTVRFYFTGNLDGLTVTANGGEAVIGAKNNMTYVEVSGINPQDLGTDVVVTVSDGTNTLSISYSPLDYLVRMYNKADSSAAHKALIQALYGYYVSAAAYTA